MYLDQADPRKTRKVTAKNDPKVIPPHFLKTINTVPVNYGIRF
jgi:hypothetical protein